MLEVDGLEAGYGDGRVLFGVDLRVAAGEVAIHHLPSYRIARLGLGLVPEGRQIFPNLSVRENLVATAAARGRRHPADGISPRSSTSFRSCASGSVIRAGSSRAASSRCWRSAAR